jgi:hypothetical protein
MSVKHNGFSVFPLLSVLLLGISFLLTGCELSGLSSEEGSGQAPISLSELNGAAPTPAPNPESPAPNPESLTPDTPAPDPDPPAPPPSSNNPYYSPGEVEIPSEFLAHGNIIDLRIGPCSVANGLMRPVAGSRTRFTLPAPNNGAWGAFANGASDFGTIVKCSDGSAWEGYVKSNTISAPMPILSIDNLHGQAFWTPL